MKNFFSITESYKFEWGDFDAVTTVLNLILIVAIGFKASFFGLAVALFGIARDLVIHRRINGLLIHVSSIILNIYFILLMIGKI